MKLNDDEKFSLLASFKNDSLLSTISFSTTEIIASTTKIADLAGDLNNTPLPSINEKMITNSTQFPTEIIGEQQLDEAPERREISQPIEANMNKNKNTEKSAKGEQILPRQNQSNFVAESDVAGTVRNHSSVEANSLENAAVFPAINGSQQT